MALVPYPTHGEQDWDAPLNAYITDQIANNSPAWVNVKSSVFGAKGDGVTDDRAAIQAAIDAAGSTGVVFIPAGVYKLDGGITIGSGTTIRGAGPSNASDDTSAIGATKLVFTGSHAGTSCISNKAPASPINHASIGWLTIRATGTYDWIWDLRTSVAYNIWSVRAEAAGNSTGGFRTQKINSSDNTWTHQFMDFEVRLPDASTARPLDVDFSDATIVGGNFTGGIGSILRGAGNVKASGVIFDRSTAWVLTISNETVSGAGHMLLGCEFQSGATGGLLIDGDADSGSATMCLPVIVGCGFWNAGGAATDVKLQNVSGSVLVGPVIANCSFQSSNSTPLSIDATRWTQVTFGPNTYTNSSWVNPLGGTPAQISATGQGLKAQNYERFAGGQSLAMAAQIARFSLVPLIAGTIVTDIAFHVEAAPGTPANLTHMKVALFKKDGTRLGVSADTPVAGRSAGTSFIALTAPVTVPTSDVYYAAVWCDGTSMPSLLSSSNTVSASGSLNGGAFPSGFQSGQADMPSPATISGTVTSVWVGAF